MQEILKNLPVDPLAASESSRADKIPPPEQRESFLAGTIISFSGWRRIFALDQEEESTSVQIDELSALFAAAAGVSFFRLLKSRAGGRVPKLAVATDTRPTGLALAYQVMRALVSEGAEVFWLSVAPTPEALCFAAESPEIDGLILITASHNPLGHNGLKFSIGDGSVLDRADNEPLKEEMLRLFRSDSRLAALKRRLLGVSREKMEHIMRRVDENKQKSLLLYRGFMDRVLSARDQAGQAEEVLARLRYCLASRPIGVVAELNGSARTCSIDTDYLNSLGVRLEVVNGEPGRIAHAILPEGEALVPACRALEEAAARDPSFELGYVPDNDGDRGNVVILGSDGRARPLEAQEVFALAVVAELSFAASWGLVRYDRHGRPRPRLAVVVNGPTSGRIDRIAAAFGAEVFRAEVGEANLVELARLKREEGYLVRILGEGSNGGNITHPSRVRDPLSTVAAFIKMARLDGLLEQWRALCPGAGESLPSRPRLEDVLRTLPPYYSTGLYEKRSLVEIASTDHNRLKSCYEDILERRWSRLKQQLPPRMGITGYRIVNYEGTRSFEGPGGRSGDGRGGFKVVLTDSQGNEVGFLWMRGSRTEPVFRIMADACTSRADEKHLLKLHRQLLLEADRAASNG